VAIGCLVVGLCTVGRYRTFRRGRRSRQTEEAANG